jgi:hypothetical protein
MRGERVPGFQRSDQNPQTATAGRVAAGRRALRGWVARGWRGHWLITSVVALSLMPRLLAALAFRPALLTPDSFGYLSEGAHPATGSWHPAGYPIMLWLFSPFHSLLLVTSVQHLLGAATAVVGYAVLRHWGLPAWGAVLAACPTLFDSRQIALESFILPDTLYALLIMAAVALLLTGRRHGQAGGPDEAEAADGPGAPGVPHRPGVARGALAGLALAGAAVTRGNGAPELVAVLAVLLIQRAGWRATAAATAAFAVPVLGYMGVFAARHGDFAITNSDGMFLWSRTMSFADCAVIKPPPSLRPLCPDQQPHHPARPAPAWSVPALLSARTPAEYLWAPAVWWRHGAHPGFNAANNSRAMTFALAAIRAQPVSYLRTVGSGVMLTFATTDRSLSVRTLHFTPVPDVPRLHGGERRHLFTYAHTTTNTHQVQPYAYFLYLYQQPVYFTGVMFGLAVLAGLAGAIRYRRGLGGPPALPLAVAVVGIVFPVAVHEYHYRYAISVVPVACLAAGLAFARRTAPPVTASPAAAPAAEPLPVGADLAAAVPAPAPPPDADQPAPQTPQPPHLPVPRGPANPPTTPGIPSLPRPRQPLTWQDEEL